jgi:hypothetical protein
MARGEFKAFEEKTIMAIKIIAGKEDARSEEKALITETSMGALAKILYF